LVAGRSNGEIAKELVISDKTVSVHVSSILRKTRTATRVEAAALAERLAAQPSRKLTTS
jgi:DNA-binding NarL/FixJ family response regulator